MFGTRSKFYPSHAKNSNCHEFYFRCIKRFSDTGFVHYYMFHFQQRNQNNEMIFAACRDVLLVKIQSYKVTLSLLQQRLHTLHSFFFIRISRLKFFETLRSIRNKRG